MERRPFICKIVTRTIGVSQPRARLAPLPKARRHTTHTDHCVPCLPTLYCIPMNFTYCQINVSVNCWTLYFQVWDKGRKFFNWQNSTLCLIFKIQIETKNTQSILKSVNLLFSFLVECAYRRCSQTVCMTQLLPLKSHTIYSYKLYSKTKVISEYHFSSSA